MKKNYMIAVCDILGFSDFVNKTPLDQIVDNNFGWLRKYLHHSIHKKDFPESIPTLQELTNHDQIGFAWFSDTFFFYTREDTDDHCHSLIQTIAWLMFETIFTTNRLRAGIAYGEAYIDPENHIYVGKPILDAYNLEEAQNWTGGAFTKSGETRVPEMVRNGKLYDWFVVPYKVPLKTNHPPSTLALDWTRGIHIECKLPWSNDSPEPTDKDWQIKPDVCLKWKNTVTFHNKVCEQCM